MTCLECPIVQTCSSYFVSTVVLHDQASKPHSIPDLEETQSPGDTRVKLKVKSLVMGVLAKASQREEEGTLLLHKGIQPPWE